MPELPEVETMRRGMAGLQGQQLTALRSCRCRAKPIAVHPSLPTIRRRLLGHSLLRVDRLGKRLVLNFGDAGHLVLEPRMTGLVVLRDAPTQAHLRLHFQFSEGLCSQGQYSEGPARDLWYWDRRGLGKIWHYTPAEWRSFLESGRVGPDALDVSQVELRRAMAGTRTAIKVAMMDQRRISGIGNLYASEILFAARIDPRQPCHTLSDADWRRLWTAMRRVLRAAVRYEGSTLADGTYRNALSQHGRYQNHHRVYAKAGEPCPRCRGPKIVRIVQAQRSTFFCELCQSS